jgi:hypothetical protein
MLSSILCQAEKKEKDIKWPLINVKKDYVRTGIKRKNRFLKVC